MITRLLPFVALLVAGALIFGYIVPTYKGTITATQGRIQSYENALAAAKRFSQKEADLAQQRAAIDPQQLARLENFLPDGVNNVQLILDMDGLAARSGMTLSNFNIDTSSVTNGSAPLNPNALVLESGDPVDSIELSVEATGTYSEFRTFLDGIERSLRPLDIVNIEVSSGANGVYRYVLTMRIYWLH
ncbi:MAG: putative pilO [Parcubacteria bacterium C7867-008]|nr:MAG: putative pilO [Parcubacteria bacterium C7867-008]